MNRGGGAPGTGVETPLRSPVKITVKLAVPLQPREINGGAHLHLQATEDPEPGQVDVPEGDCDPWEAHSGALGRAYGLMEKGVGRN